MAPSATNSANLVNGILIDRRHERLFTNLYHRIADGSVRANRLIYESKKLVMRRALASEVNVLTHMLDGISNQDRGARDLLAGYCARRFARPSPAFPVYRTYIDERGHVSETGRLYIQRAIDCAKRQNRNPGPRGVRFPAEHSAARRKHRECDQFRLSRQLYFTLKFQQLTGPVMAKGLEDTACYVYNRFISVNEVGGITGRFRNFGVRSSIARNELRAEQWPTLHAGTSTHDTKRSEDVRARLDVLSEMPQALDGAGHEVASHESQAQSRDFQMAGSFPTTTRNICCTRRWWEHGRCGWTAKSNDSEFIGRIQRYMEKAVARGQGQPELAQFQPGLCGWNEFFVERILVAASRGKTNLFLDSVQRFLPPLMYFGCINSLTQTLLKLTCPGVPDIYQGQEMWNFSLVDPDNRRPVDFGLRVRAAEEFRTRAETGDPLGICQELLRDWRDGRIKLWVTMRTLNFAASMRNCFAWEAIFPWKFRAAKMSTWLHSRGSTLERRPSQPYHGLAIH